MSKYNDILSFADALMFGLFAFVANNELFGNGHWIGEHANKNPNTVEGRI